MKLDPVVKKETGYIALWTLILSVLMEAVFLILRKWNLPVLFGNLLGGGAAIGNFLLMGMTLTRALTMEQKKAKMTAIISQIGRYLLLALAMVLGFKLPFLNPWATLIPLLFPRFAIMLRAIKGGEPAAADSVQTDIKAGDADE
ncbi:MAG: ATP synthase subunit I [Firmicutes bacterium]|nr:ATP synthase subunit I [Bacillota bacterium]